MSWFDKFTKNGMQKDVQDLLKSDGLPDAPSAPDVMIGDKLPDMPEKGHDAEQQIGRKAIIDDPFFDNFGQHVVQKLKMSRLSNRTLKEVSIRDWLVSAILQCRVDTLLQFSRPNHKRFDLGFRFVKRDASQEYTDEDRDNITKLESFIYHCGRIENTPPGDRMLFGEFLKLCARDALTFGHVAIEKIKTKGGGLHRFRPLPAESVYLINPKLSRQFLQNYVDSMRDVYAPKGDNDPRAEQVVNEVPLDYYKYVQISYDGRPMATFGNEDMIWKLFNPQNFADSAGYCYSPLELAIINVTNHMNVENYNSNFFTHGYAARGILHLKGTVTQGQVINFRRQFYNAISGQQHAWHTPIVAGLDEVEWIPMSASAKEMEYINFNNHVMRILCAQFAIDPVELGLDYLISANGRAPMQQANNEYKIEYSRERGLNPILMFFEDLINGQILPAIDQNLANIYKFIFTGYNDETPQNEIAQMQAEMTVYKSLNDLLTQAQKKKIDTPAADLPMNQAFWMLIEKNYTRGEIREMFFGDKGAINRRELSYIPGDPAFLQWQQLLLTIDTAKEQKEQMAAQAQQVQKEQLYRDNQEKRDQVTHQREGEKHEHEMRQLNANAAHNAVAGGMKTAAKEFGASKAENVGGKEIANPINKLPE